MMNCASRLILKRGLSSSIAVESTRVAMAKNILKANAITAAADEAALAGAIKANYKFDVNAVPAELAGWEDLAIVSSKAGAYKRDPTAWQNMSFVNFVATESARDSTWPFIVGAMVTYFLLGYLLPSCLPQEGRKKSKYVQMLEGKHQHGPECHDCHGKEHGHEQAHAH